MGKEVNLEAAAFNNAGVSYQEYRNIIDELIGRGQTSGPQQSEDLFEYTKMNVQRMNRLDKTLQLEESFIRLLKEMDTAIDVLVISEAWCGDAAQIVPVVQQIVAASDGKLTLKIVFRDANLPLIDQHLTNGGRAIPILLFLDRETQKLLAKWGPRPKPLQEKMKEWKLEISDIWEISKLVHTWYAKDKTLTTQAEIMETLVNLR